MLVICSLTLQTATAQNKVVILDSLTAKKVIKDLVNFDITKAELKNCVARDSISQLRIKTFQKANATLLSAYNQKDAQSVTQGQIIDLKDKIISKERNKNIFWKITSYLGVGVSIYLLLLK